MQVHLGLRTVGRKEGAQADVLANARRTDRAQHMRTFRSTLRLLLYKDKDRQIDWSHSSHLSEFSVYNSIAFVY